MNKLTGKDLHWMFWGVVESWETCADKPRWDHLAAAVNNHAEAMAEERHISIKVTERSVYNALKNLLQGQFGITRDTVMLRILDIVRPQEVIEKWMNGQNVRSFVDDTARSVIRDLAAPIIREEAQKAINGRIKITIGDTP